VWAPAPQAAPLKEFSRNFRNLRKKTAGQAGLLSPFRPVPIRPPVPIGAIAKKDVRIQLVSIAIIHSTREP